VDIEQGRGKMVIRRPEVSGTAVLMLAVLSMLMYGLGNAQECGDMGGVCQNNAECAQITDSTQYYCKCQGAWTGEFCDEVNHCYSNPCSASSTCYNMRTSYECRCANGLLGLNCNVLPQTSGCESDPCMNGGQCQVIGDDVSQVTCQCPDAFTGDQCQRANPCFTQPCQNGGVCAESGTGYVCACPGGYTGDECQFVTVIRPCDAQPCHNNGVCYNRVDDNTYFCVCSSGFTGNNCETGECLFTVWVGVMFSEQAT
jgi:hypothetical protein